MGKFKEYSPGTTAVIKKDNTISSVANQVYEGITGGDSDGVISEFFNLQVGDSRAFYIKALTDCEVSIGGYIHSSLSESNKFSAIEIYNLGFEIESIKPVVGDAAIDHDQPRQITITADGVTNNTVNKRIYSENYTTAELNIVDVFSGDFLTSDLAAVGEVIYLPTTSEPTLLSEGTIIAQSESATTQREINKVFLNEFQEILVVFTNMDTVGTNEADADVHLTIKYSKVEVR